MTDATQPMPPAPPPAATPGPPAGDAPHPARRWLVLGGAVVAAVALLTGAFFLGRSTGSTTQTGPTSLAAALTDARNGSLPCGTSSQVTTRALDRLCNGAASGGGAATGAAGTGGRALMLGTVQSVDGDQVTIQTGQGPVSLTVGSTAQVRTVTPGAASDLTTGARVVLTGGRQAGGVRQILVLGAAGRFGAGAVGAIPTS